ncbi:MAG: PEGA domain-containing protein [Polyangiaceae bacterium]|nr:PEGA domain-containing protein [Polyangiaceae bacterium]
MPQMMPSSPELRPYTDSIVDLSESALVPLEPSAPDLAPYEELSAEPTVKRLPDFSLLDDLPTAPKPGLRHDTLLPPPSEIVVDRPSALPPIAPLPKKPASSLPPIAPSPKSKADSLPPIGQLPKKPVKRALPPASPLPKKKSRSLPPIAALPARASSSAPPAMPRELPRAQATLEWDIQTAELPTFPEDNERTSVMPVSGAAEVKRRARSWTHGLPLTAGALLGLLVFAAAFFALRPAPSAKPASPPEALLVTIAGPGGGAVESPQVFIDGVRRCESSPCMVPGLAEGLHFVTVSAREHVTTSPRVVRVAEQEQALLHIDLARETAPASPEPATTTAVEALPLESSPPPALTPAPPPTAAVEAPAAAPAPVAAPAPPRMPSASAEPGSAFLNLNSIPPSAVLVDGRPLGMTPKVNVPVKPGAHVVVFVHPEHGRRARAVMVDAGSRQTVAMRLSSGE